MAAGWRDNYHLITFQRKRTNNAKFLLSLEKGREHRKNRAAERLERHKKTKKYSTLPEEATPTT